MSDDTIVGGVERIAQLMSETREARQRAEYAEQELADLRASAAYLVGRLLVRSAKKPRRLLTLPQDLWRVWRRKRRHRGSHQPPTVAPRVDRVIDRDLIRLIVPRIHSAALGGSLTIAGALGSATARAWSPYATVRTCLPHEAALLAEAIDPDLVVIDTSASLPGERWAHLGDAAALDRLAAAGDLVDTAHALGRPVVLLRMTPPWRTASLDRLAERCDLVVDGPGSSRRTPWHPGVDPMDRVPTASGSALLVASGDHPGDPDDEAITTAPRVERLDATLPDHIAWRQGLTAATGVLLAPTPAGLQGATPRGLSALVSGRRVLAPGDDDTAAILAIRPAGRDGVLTDRDRVALSAAAGAGPEPLTSAEHRAAFAAIVVAASAPVQLTTLAASLGIDRRPRACWDIALVVDTEVDPDEILAQSWRPREVVTAAPLSDRACAALGESGIATRIAPSTAEADCHRLGLVSPYLAVRVELGNPHALVDLLAEELLGISHRGLRDAGRLVRLT